MKLGDYQFRAFDEDCLTATQKLWTTEAPGAGVFPAEVEQIFDWARARLTRVNNEQAFGVFPKTEGTALAIVELVVVPKTRKTKVIKMLRMRLSPSVEAKLASPDVVDAWREALGLFAIALKGVLRMRNGDDGADATVKVYGRSNEQLAFLKGFVIKLQEDKTIKGHVFQMDGRWMVVKTP